MPRNTVAIKKQSKTHTISCYDEEWKILSALVVIKKLHTPFDVVRFLMQESIDREVVGARDEKPIRGGFRAPRPASDRTLKIRS